MLRYLSALCIAVAALSAPAPALCADRVVTLAADSPFAGTVRLGEANGGPAVRELVAPDVAEAVFASKDDDGPVHGWFTRTFKAALKKNGMLAKKPEAARYELTAEVKSMTVTPLATGSHHVSEVTYRLREIATGRTVWEEAQTTDMPIERGIRFGKIGGALGGAMGGALTGQNPAVTAASISASQGRVRPFDVRIDVYEGVMKGFQDMAKRVVKGIAASPAPAS